MKNNNVVKLSSFGPFPKPEIKKIQCGDAEVEVVNIISYEDVFEMIQWTIDFIVDDRPFIAEPIRQLMMDFALLKYYTNLDIEFLAAGTEISDIYSNYDFIKVFNVINMVKEIIDPDQLAFYTNCLNRTIESVLKYKNSTAGLVDNLILNAKEDGTALQQFFQVTENDSNIKKMVNLINAADAIRNPITNQE